MARVYALLNGNVVTRLEGEYTLPTDLDGWTLIDEGDGDRYNLAQTHYLPMPLTDERGIYRYKRVLVEHTNEDGEIVSSGYEILERTEEEMDADFVKRPKPPLSEIEMLRKQIEAQNEILDFYEECIAEMAEIVYA